MSSGEAVEEWIWDHPQIDDGDILYRRIKNKPDIVAVDLATNKARLMPMAFKYDENSGMSIDIGSIAEACGMAIASLCQWGEYGLAYFNAKLARSENSGVIHDPVEEDKERGVEEDEAHGLVRVRERLPTKSEDHRTWWLPIRSRLMEQASYVAAEADVDGTPSKPKCELS